MGLANCNSCGRLFNQTTFQKVCPKCHREEERQFYVVRDYLRENRRSTLYELSDSTETPVSLIIKWIREGRISTANHPELHYPCESCGGPTWDGKFCKTCKERLAKGFEQTKQELKEHQKTDLYKSAYYHRRNE